MEGVVIKRFHSIIGYIIIVTSITFIKGLWQEVAKLENNQGNDQATVNLAVSLSDLSCQVIIGQIANSDVNSDIKVN